MATFAELSQTEKNEHHKNIFGILARHENGLTQDSPKEIILKVAKDKGFNPGLIYPFIKLSAKKILNTSFPREPMALNMPISFFLALTLFNE